MTRITLVGLILILLPLIGDASDQQGRLEVREIVSAASLDEGPGHSDDELRLFVQATAVGKAKIPALLECYFAAPSGRRVTGEKRFIRGKVYRLLIESKWPVQITVSSRGSRNEDEFYTDLDFNPRPPEHPSDWLVRLVSEEDGNLLAVKASAPYLETIGKDPVRLKATIAASRRE